MLGAHLMTPVVYSAFFSSAEPQYSTPGISDGAIQQGYTYFEGKNVFLHSGYMVDGSASRIYIVDASDTDNVRYVSLATADGQPYDGHAGGIAAYGNFVWLAKSSGDDCLWRIDADSLLSCENGDVLVLDTPFYVDCTASFCHVDENFVWVGEFMSKDESSDYEFKTADGSTNNGLILGYGREDAEALDADTPSIAYSIRYNVQGMATYDGHVVLSTSWAINTSHLLFYSTLSDTAVLNSVNIDGKSVPLIILDESNLVSYVPMQPMAEEIVAKDGKIYVAFESASKKYIFGHFTRGIRVYAYQYGE